MIKRIIIILVVAASLGFLSSCAPQPTEPALLEKIEDAMIFTSQSDGQDNDLSIEAIVPNADLPEVAVYLDKLRTDKGQAEYEYNFDYIKEVMQSDAATVDDAMYGALIITFTEMPDEDKETFLECAYIKTDKSQKWDVSSVLIEMSRRCKGLLDNTDMTFENLVDRDCGIQDLIFGYSLLKQAKKYANIEPNGSFAKISVEIERVPDVECDAVLSFGVSDDKGNVKNIYTVNVLAFREHIQGVLNTVVENAVPKLTEAHAKQLVTDGNASYALYMGASISYTNDGKYEVNLSAIDPFRLNMALRAFAKARENDGLGCSAIEVGEALKSGSAEELKNNELTINDYIDWYLISGDTKTDKQYYSALLIAYDNDLKQSGVDLSEEEKLNQVDKLTYEDMVKLEQEYPECFE